MEMSDPLNIEPLNIIQPYGCACDFACSQILVCQNVRAKGRNTGGKWSVAQKDMTETIRRGECMGLVVPESVWTRPSFSESHSQCTIGRTMEVEN